MEARNASEMMSLESPRSSWGCEVPFSASLAALPMAGNGGKSTLMTRGFMSSIIEKEPAVNETH